MFTALKGSQFNFHLLEGLSEPEFYGDFVYKKQLMGRKDFSFQFRKIRARYRHIGYNLNVCCLAHRSSTGVFLLLRVSVSYSAPRDLHRLVAY